MLVPLPLLNVKSGLYRQAVVAPMQAIQAFTPLFPSPDTSWFPVRLYPSSLTPSAISDPPLLLLLSNSSCRTSWPSATSLVAFLRREISSAAFCNRVVSLFLLGRFPWKLWAKKSKAGKTEGK